MNTSVGKLPVVSVVVPVYNVEQWLPICIESIIHQTYTNIEVLLVDDGATDNSGRICDNFALRDSRIRVIHKKNGGLSDARNVGIDNAQGDFITLVDSDDYIAYTMIEHLVTLQQESNADITVCQHHRIDERGLLLSKPQSEVSKAFVKGRNNCMPAYLKSDNVGTVAWGKLYRASLFVGIRYPIGKFHEDVFTTYKLIDRCESIAILSLPLYYYRQRNNSITQMSFSPRHMDAVWGKMEMAEYISKHYPSLVKYANADIIYAANQCLFRIIHSVSRPREPLEFLQNIYRKYAFDYISLKRPFKNNIFVLLSYVNIKWINCILKR